MSRTYLGGLAEGMGVRAGMKLANGGTMNPALEKFLAEMHRRGHHQGVIANALNEVGVTSASGLMVTNDHVSNALRKSMGRRMVSEYTQPNCQGENWITHTKRQNRP